MQNQLMYLNGSIVPASEAALSPMDIGVLRGYAVFDLLRTVHGAPFMLSEHLKRFHSSAAQLGLKVPVSDEAIEAAIVELLVRNGYDAENEATVRLVLTGGVSPDGMSFDPETPTFYVVTHALPSLPVETYRTGAKLLTVNHTREIPLAKTTNYLTMLQNQARAAEAGATDLLYHDGTRVFEAASASVYFVHGSRILAPSDEVLWGTIGAMVLELAGDDYEVVHGDVSLQDAFSADEVFLTSSTRDVLPIVQIDDTVLGDGTPGPVTRDLMQRYRTRVYGA